MRLLFVGDPHVKPSELEDCERLMEMVKRVATVEKVDHIVLLGDLFHTHSIIHLEVLDFWTRWLPRLSQKCGVMALVGNHDKSGDNDDPAHALMSLRNHASVVDSPTVVENVLFLPYYANQNKLVEAANSSTQWKTLVCHATFDGSTYDNGFYAKDALDPNLLNVEHIISGHIHTPQQFGKVWYPGAPRWQTVSDANIDRHIWVVDFENGIPTNKKSYDTSVACLKILNLKDCPNSPLDPETVERLSGTAKVCVDVQGPETFIQQRKEIYSRMPVRLRTFRETERGPAVKESEGIQTAFRNFLRSGASGLQTSLEQLEQMAKERLGV
jgi:DNA repair exonuclease SbcCD nuclease subunit